jgi:D-3-phosphoglycerate dehydrogenase
MMWKVVMTLDLPAYADINEKSFVEIQAHFFKKQCNSEEEIIALAYDADAIITVSLYQKITRKVIEQLRHCKIIANIGIGYEGIDVEASTECGICVANVADYCLNEVSEHTLALMMACARRLFTLDRLVREGKWTVDRPEMRYEIYPTIHRLHNQTLGLIGFGRIPQTIVPKVKELVSRILTYDPYVSPDIPAEMGVELVDLDVVLSQSDFVSIHANLTPETKGLIGMAQFKKMKSTAYLINTSRGPLVDRNALYTALSQGMIAGAALDVLDPEPLDPNDPILQLNNVILTGHSAFASVEANVELHKRPIEEVIRVFNGEWPRNFINPQVKDLFRAKHGKGTS